jgi:hypothetical protein
MIFITNTILIKLITIYKVYNIMNFQYSYIIKMKTEITIVVKIFFNLLFFIIDIKL